MKSVKEIKVGLSRCSEGCALSECPYYPVRYGAECQGKLASDALEYIEQLEERIAIMTEGANKNESE